MRGAISRYLKGSFLPLLLKYFSNPFSNRNVGSLFKPNPLFYAAYIVRAIGASKFPFYMLTEANRRFHSIKEREANKEIFQGHWKIAKIAK